MNDKKKNEAKVNNEKDKNIDNTKYEIGEDVTKYGETIPTSFDWVSLEKQKKIVNKLEKITEKENKK